MRPLPTKRVLLWRKVLWSRIRCVAGTTGKSDCPEVAWSKSQSFSRITLVKIASWGIRFGVICVETHSTITNPRTEIEKGPRGSRDQNSKGRNTAACKHLATSWCLHGRCKTWTWKARKCLSYQLQGQFWWYLCRIPRHKHQARDKDWKGH